MASGFQQDTNQLAPSFFRVVLTLSGGTGTYTGAAPADGAVNPYNWDSFATLPSSDANASKLARGNMRWQAIIEEVTKYSDAQVLDVEVVSADNTDANSLPTNVAFTVKYDRVDFLFQALNGATDIGGNTVDTAAKALKHQVVTGIQRGAASGYTRKWFVYDPDDLNGKLVEVTIQRPDADADVYADVAVNLLDGTELTSTV
jgi:hypothetical protein